MFSKQTVEQTLQPITFQEFQITEEPLEEAGPDHSILGTSLLESIPVISLI